MLALTACVALLAPRAQASDGSHAAATASTAAHALAPHHHALGHADAASEPAPAGDGACTGGHCGLCTALPTPGAAPLECHDDAAPRDVPATQPSGRDPAPETPPPIA